MRDIPLQAIREASGAIYDSVVRTPLVRLELPPDLERRLGRRRRFSSSSKRSSRIGAFKIRGAYNVVRQLSAAQTRKTASGRSAPATPRKAWRCRAARRRPAAPSW